MTINNQSNRRSFLKTAASAAVLGTATLAAPAIIASPNTKIKWKIQTHWSAGSWYYKPIYETLAERIKQATNGELEIEVHQANAIVSTGDVLKGVRRGTLDGALIYPAYWIGDIPVAGHLNGNLATWDNYDEMQFFMRNMGALDIIREAYAERGVYQVGPISNGGTALFSNKRLETIDDFKGFKVRSNGSSAQVFEKMGAAPVSVPGNELYQSLQTGVVDGAHWGGISAGFGMNLNEVTKYIIQPNLVGHQNSEFFVSMKQWNKLGDDFKRIIQDAVQAADAEAAGLFSYQDYLEKQKFLANGGEVLQMNDDVISLMRQKTLEVVDLQSKKDPKYSGKVGALLHEFMALTGKI